jgi:hypothetical protein
MMTVHMVEIELYERRTGLAAAHNKSDIISDVAGLFVRSNSP